MEQYELLVHVSAPARFQDDRRYLSIAQSILDFEAAAVTAITPPEGSLMDQHDTYLLNLAEQLQSPPSNSLLSDGTPREEQRALERKAAASPADWPRKNPGSRLSSTKDHTSAYNPPYRNPYHGAQSRDSFVDPRTPHQEVRPRTAPDQLERTVQVPFTGIGKRRANSESASYGSLSSWISNSQHSQQGLPFGSQPNPRSIVEETFVQDMAANKSMIRSFSEASLDDESTPKRARMSREHEVAAAILQPRPNGIDAFLFRDRSLDWTSSPTCSAASGTDSIPSTASLSQPLPTPVRSAELSHSSGSQAVPAVHVDLTFTSSSRDDASQRTPLLGDTGGDASSHHSHEHSSSIPSQHGSSRLFGADLPVEVKSADPPTGQIKFTSHITPPLADLASRLPFERCFKPVEVKRDVGVLERGFWVMDVAIADAEVVEAARRSPTKEEKLQAVRNRFVGVAHEERMKKYEAAKQDDKLKEFDYGFEDKAVGLLTAEEFVIFWRNVSSFIETGKAGWGIRMVRETLDPAPSIDGIVRIRVRTFGWGEIIGHLYLALWVLSDKVTARIPMEWMAGDGAAVVKMAGTWNGRGKLGIWTRKGPAGEGGCWGVGGR